MTAVAAVLAYRSYQGNEEGRQTYLGRLRSALRKYSEAFLLGAEISSSLLHRPAELPGL